MANEIIETFGDLEAVEIERTTPGEYDQTTGKWVDGIETIIPFLAVVLPLSRQDAMDELGQAGIEDRDGIVVYSEIQLFEASKENKQDRDIILWKARQYVVEKCDHRYQIDDLEHYKSICILKNS